MNFHTHNEDGFLINYSNSSFDKDILNLEMERKEILNTKFIYPSDKPIQLNKLAEIACLNSFKEFSLETFHLSLKLLEKPLEFYECLSFLKFLQITDFEGLKEKMSRNLYKLSEYTEDSFNDKLLKKLKTIEFSTTHISTKLNEEILSGLFSSKEKLRINHSLADCVPYYIIYHLKNNSFNLANIILSKFNEYIVEIIELMVSTNSQSNNLVLLKAFLTNFMQKNSPENIGNEKFNEIHLLAETLGKLYEKNSTKNFGEK